MKVFVPEELKPFEPELRYFVDTMVRKLWLNRHKGFAQNVSVDSLLMACRKEMTELTEAIAKESQMQVMSEGADVANMAFLVALATLRMTRPDFENNRRLVGG